MKRLIEQLLLACAVGAFLFSCDDGKDEQPLEALFSADKQEVVSGDMITFTDESLGNPTRWNWEFEGGDPATSQLTSPKVAYTVPGKYKVTLSVSRGDSEPVTIVKEGYVTVDYPAVLTADFQADRTSAYDSDEIQFTDLSTGYPTAWSWEFVPQAGQTITSAVQNPKMVFPAGIYTVKLTASNAVNNDVEEKAGYLEIIDPNAVSADFTVNHKICYAGMTVRFSDASLGRATQWSWTFDGASPETETSTEQNPEVVFTQAGKHKVTLVASNDTNTSTKEVDAYISVVPGNLSGIYFFEEDATDYGPNQNHGVPKLRNTAGKIEFVEDSNQTGRRSVKFTRQAYIEVADHEAFNVGTGDFTYSFWIKVTLKNTQLCAYMEGGGNLPTTKSQNYFRLEQHHSTPTNKYASWCTEANVNVTGSAWCEPKGANTLDDGQWHHIVTRRSGVEHNIFIDGTLAATKTASAQFMASDDGPLLIGCMADSGGGRKGFFEGCIDDFIVYKRALTDEEVAILYNY